MRDLFYISQTLLTAHLKPKNGSLVRRIAYGVFLALAVSPMLYLLYSIFSPLIVMGSGQMAFGLGLMMICFFGLTSVLFAFPSSFYFSDDTRHLVVLPVKPYAITGAKLIEIFASQLLSTAIIVLPMTAAFIVSGTLNLWQIVLMLLSALILVPGVITLVLGILFLLLGSAAPAMMTKDRFAALSSAFGIFLLIGLMWFNTSASDNPGQMVQTVAGQQWYELVQGVFFQIGLAVKAVLEQDWVSLVLLLALAAGLTAVFLLLANKLYLPAAASAASVKTSSRKVKQTDFASASFLKSAVLSEIRQVLRSPTYASNVLISAAMTPILWIIIFAGAGKGESLASVTKSLDLTGQPLAAYAFLAGVAVSFTAASTTAFASTAISRKGVSGTRFMCQIPERMTSQLQAILIPGIAISVLGCMTMIVLMHLLFVYPAWLDLVFLLGAALACTLDNLVGLLCDVMHPKLIWDSEKAAIKSNMNSLFVTLFSMGLIVLLAAPGVTFFSPLVAAFGLDVFFNCYAAGVFVLLCILITAVYLYLMKTARRHLMKAV